MPINAIETYYAGHRFRSRLEARWANVFDALSVRWEYEPQGYYVGESRRAYLPDFYLTDLNWWVEVKGDPMRLDLRLLADAVHPTLGLGRCDPYYRTNLLILGSIPDYGDGFTPAHFSLSRSAGIGTMLDCEGACPFTAVRYGLHHFVPVVDLPRPESPLPEFDALARFGALLHPACVPGSRPPYDDLTQSMPIEHDRRMPHLEAAYTLGRTARFEHGEAA